MEVVPAAHGRGRVVWGKAGRAAGGGGGEVKKGRDERCRTSKVPAALYAFAEATVPKLTVVTRRAYGRFSPQAGTSCVGQGRASSRRRLQ